MREKRKRGNRQARRGGRGEEEKLEEGEEERRGHTIRLNMYMYG